MAATQSQRTSWLPALVLVGAALFGYLVLPHVSRRVSPSAQLIGAPAPDFSLPVFHGGDAGSRIRLSALQGNVVILDFWASWCKPCQAQARILSGLAPRHAGGNVMFVGVNTADNPDRAEAFAASHQLPYPSVLDAGEVADAYGASSLPTLVVIDTFGKVSDVTLGVLSAEEIETAIRAASAGAAKPPG
ncbi:MAG TPA: TlpA disulfide reductase family protein [Polyangiaceae bacterium]|nr:TlpA disulfide reductase family protein [Polyangiaceae bacterium]